MSPMFAEIRDTLVPQRDGKFGPLPPMLVAMTVVTGLVDAVSYLMLGHVFVANMTGNVVFLGFALAGAPGFSIGASLVALLAFALGAFVGGKIGTRFGNHRGRFVGVSAAAQAVALAVAFVLAAASAAPIEEGYRYGLILVLGAAMGIQNASTRRLAIPDLTTTVLTLTITGIAADQSVAGGPGSRAGRRMVSVVAMGAGAFIGAAFVIHGHATYPLALACIAIAVIAAAAWTLGSSDPQWVRVSPDHG